MAYRPKTDVRGPQKLGGRKWDDLSIAVRRAEPWCRLCLAKGLHVPAVASDHIVPRAAGGSVHDPRNVQPLCRECHAAKTRADVDHIRSMSGTHVPRVEIVCHPPGAPVLEWVQRQYAAGDAIACFDAIVAALVPPGSRRPAELANRLRDATIAYALDGLLPGRLWLTSSRHDASDLLAERFRASKGEATIHYLAHDLDDCERRINGLAAARLIDADDAKALHRLASSWHAVHAMRCA